uniref:transposase n=1 Tax=Pseudoalteromonas sp. TaxID=53249 RepID=UPI00235599EA
RYTRKGVMSESRLVSATEETVSFKYRDYKDNNRNKVMTLSCDEFLRRYLQHILPKGFMRIRHYGFLANACRKQKLALIRTQESHTCKPVKPKTEKDPLIPHWPCQSCKVGILRFIGIAESDAATVKTERTS